MKLITLRLNTANKPLPISEGVTEIQINNQPYKGTNLTTWHTQAQKAPRVTTVHNAVKETIKAHLTLMHIFHKYASAAHRGWPMHYPIIHPLGMVG
jgi:hypothetical protein